MEVMEEGNLLDRVRILLQRDLDYYEHHQTILQETLCPGVVGGLLDFPRYASFAAVKLVMWWEEQFTATFRKGSGLMGGANTSLEPADDAERGCGGIVTNAAPNEFVKMTRETSSQLLEHLHVLTQEALDHADLTVLTGTLGAAALIKNCLWCYNEQLDSKGGLSLHSSYKQYQEMSEALAERLLDLHCRLLSLYVLQDADSLSWDNPQPFFEGERGSFVVQMWWLYMQGTREDLWSTVPPKTAQRVLSGMLNETLTILATRYNLAEPSPARAQLLVTDIGNLLMCVSELLPSICNDASELVGLGGSKALRDIHAKCQQLLICLILRGAPLATLYKVFRNGLENVPAFDEREESFSPWMLLVSPELGLNCANQISDLPDGCAILLELNVLTAQPQPSYPLLLNVLTIRDYKVLTLLLNKTIPLLKKEDTGGQRGVEEVQCKGFLCSGGDCTVVVRGAHDVVCALVYIMMSVCTTEDISRLVIPALESTGPSWANCFDRHQVWNLNRVPWMAAFLAPLEAPLTPLVRTLVDAMSTGATLQQTLALTLESLVRTVDIVPPEVFRVALILQEDIPADVKPLGKSVLLQMLISEVYGLLVKVGSDAATALAEALCHLRTPPQIIEQLEDAAEEFIEDNPVALVSDITVSRLLCTSAGRHALQVAFKTVVENEEWIKSVLLPGYAPAKPPNKLLHNMFHIGMKSFDQILSGKWKPDYQGVLEKPLSLSKETAWLHLSRRAEFLQTFDRSDQSTFSKHDKAVVDNLSALFLSAD